MYNFLWAGMSTAL